MLYKKIPLISLLLIFLALCLIYISKNNESDDYQNELIKNNLIHGLSWCNCATKTEPYFGEIDIKIQSCKYYEGRNMTPYTYWIGSPPIKSVCKRDYDCVIIDGIIKNNTNKRFCLNRLNFSSITNPEIEFSEYFQEYTHLPPNEKISFRIVTKVLYAKKGWNEMRLFVKRLPEIGDTTRLYFPRDCGVKRNYIVPKIIPQGSSFPLWEYVDDNYDPNY